ncbi:hypothetical protein QYF36_012057 [Acer negundo]|nr:hypothetical protein QYF36_012057 [Acer negundo]
MTCQHFDLNLNTCDHYSPVQYIPVITDLKASINLHQAIAYTNLIKNCISWQKMVRKRFQEAKTGVEWLKSIDADRYLKKIGLGKEDWYFWKQIGKALLCTYTLFGVAWVYNETSPFGWWTLKPRPKEEKEMAHLYERIQFPYPGDTEAMEEFIRKGGMIGSVYNPKGMIESDRDANAYQQVLKDKKFEQESQKMWLRMRSEVIQELQEQGFIDVE